MPSSISRRNLLLATGATCLVPLLTTRRAGAQDRARLAGQDEIGLSVVETPYYNIHTDLQDELLVREAGLRMTAMAEEYTRRTRGFTQQATPTGMRFYLMSSQDTYRQVGGLPGTAGIFQQSRSATGQIERKLMAFMRGNSYDARKATWRTVQHEGFHQFSYLAIGGRKPAWMEEGLAECFEVAEWCGDSFVVGLIPPERVQQIHRLLERNAAIPFERIMTVSRADWNSALSSEAYLQSWSMVHFLLYADNGRWLPMFEEFLKAVQRGVNWIEAWKSSFGLPQQFAEVWLNYWRNTAPEATVAAYIEATLRKLTTFFARSRLSGDTFGDLSTFTAAASRKAITIHRDAWLPPGLLDEAIAEVNRYANAGMRFTLVDGENNQPDLAAIFPDGKRILARWYRGNEKPIDRIETRYIGS